MFDLSPRNSPQVDIEKEKIRELGAKVSSALTDLIEYTGVKKRFRDLPEILYFLNVVTFNALDEGEKNLIHMKIEEEMDKISLKREAKKLQKSMYVTIMDELEKERSENNALRKTLYGWMEKNDLLNLKGKTKKRVPVVKNVTHLIENTFNEFGFEDLEEESSKQLSVTAESENSELLQYQRELHKHFNGHEFNTLLENIIDDFEDHMEGIYFESIQHVMAVDEKLKAENLVSQSRIDFLSAQNLRLLQRIERDKEVLSNMASDNSRLKHLLAAPKRK